MDLDTWSGKLTALGQSLLPKIMDYGARLLGAIIIYFVGRMLIKMVNRGLEKVMNRGNFDQTLIDFSKNVVRLTLTFLVVLMAANTLGFDTTSFMAVVGAAGLAIGLALKGSLDNVASGVMLVGLRQIRVGDYIEVSGHEGFVEHIRVFNSLIRTRDNKVVIIPNSEFTSSAIVNYSLKGNLRAQLVFGISYEDDIPKAKEIIYEVLRKNPRVLKTPEPFVGVKTMNESSIDFDVHAWVEIQDYWAVRWELTEVAKIELEAGGITIPFPQRDVHFYPHEDALKVEQFEARNTEAA